MNQPPRFSFQRQVMEKPLHVFCCYARSDQSYLHELKKRLISLQRNGLITVSADIDISPGDEWKQKIRQYLETAHIILLLVSPDFIASNYCYSEEMMRALERHREGSAYVIPVILRPINLQSLPFGDIQSLPTNAQPVTRWKDLDDALLDVEVGITKVVERCLQHPRMSSSRGEMTLKRTSYRTKKIASPQRPSEAGLVSMPSRSQQYLPPSSRNTTDCKLSLEPTGREKPWAAWSYLLPALLPLLLPIVILTIYLVGRKSRFVRFHLVQGFLFFLTFAVIGTIACLLTSWICLLVASSSRIETITIVLIICFVSYCLADIAWTVFAAQGEHIELPVIGRLAKIFANKAQVEGEAVSGYLAGNDTILSFNDGGLLFLICYFLLMGASVNYLVIFFIIAPFFH